MMQEQMQEQVKSSCHSLSVLSAIELFNSNLETGLTAEEVAICYEKYGYNQLPLKPQKPAWIKFLLQFHSAPFVAYRYG